MKTTLVDELDRAAMRAEIRAQETDERTAGVRWQYLREILATEAARLRQRAAWVRELRPPTFTFYSDGGLGDLYLALTGADIPETKEPTK